MMTTTHMLVGSAIATRKTMPNWVLCCSFFGAAVPDLNIAIMLLWARFTQFDGNLWRAPEGLYWQEPWQTYSAIVNSFPLYAVGFVGSFLLLRRAGRLHALFLGLMVFFAAAMVHVALDFPVHTHDAHQHLWPLSDWRFHSFMSYYQSSAYGDIVQFFEIGFGVIAAWFLLRRPMHWAARGFVVLLVLPYILMIIPRRAMMDFFSLVGAAFRGTGVA